MIFNKLRLKNFKSHENTVINLEPCVNLIIGENGAGKTTILEAISFALFKQYTTKKIVDLVKTNKNKNLEENMEVTLEFNVDGKDYKIIRKISKLSSNNNVKIKSHVKLLIKEENGYYVITTGDKQVNDEIQAILNMDSDLFLNAIYIRQGEIADLIRKTPSEKKKIIAKLLRIDSLEKAWNNILPLINSYENQKSELKGKISSINELKQELDNKKLILNDLYQKSEKFEMELKSLEKNKDEYSLKKNNMESEKSVFETLNNNLANESEIVKKVKEDKINFQKQIEAIEKMEKEMLLLIGEVKKLPLYLDFEESVKKIKSLKKDEKFLKSKLTAIRDCKEILKNEKNGYREYVQIQEKLNDFNEEKEKYEVKNQLAKKVAKDIEQLNLKISKNKKNISNFFKSTNKELKTNFNDLKELDTHLKELKEKIQGKIANLKDNISLKNQENSALKESIKNVETPLIELKNTDNQCPICKSNISKDKKEDLLNSYKSLIEKNENLINSNKYNIKKLNIEKDVFNSKLAIVEKVESDISFNEYIFKEINEDIEKIKELQDNIKDNEEVKLKLAEIISSVESLNQREKIKKNSYDNYIKSLGSLDTLGGENKAKEKLRNIIQSIDLEVEKIKDLLEKDSSLSTDMKEDKLKEKINSLKVKDQKYNQLKGSINQKNIVESQFSSCKKDLKWRESKIEKIKEDIKVCKYDEELYKSILHSYEKIADKVEELYKNISEIRGKTTEIKSFINNINKKLDENKEYEKKLDNIADYLKLLKEIRSLYGKDGIQKDLRNKSRPLIQKNSMKFFEKFNFNYSDLKIDEDYNISVFSPEGETNLDMVSGGEKIAIALALRLGITQLMSSGNLETILLDEPTIHLDKYRRTELIELLMNMSVIPQMIIVTHDNELENAADNIIKVKKENGISEVVSN
jgi:exonuclease SbcC